MFRIIITLLFVTITQKMVSGQTFRDISQEIGLNHVHTSGILMGGGVVVFDFDNDGFEDFYFTGGTSSDGIYKNLYGKELVQHWNNRLDSYNSMSGSAGDLDNDGFKDLIIGTYKGETLKLIRNIEGANFVIQTDTGIEEKPWTHGVVLIDFNNDGLLDIVSLNYIDKIDIRFDENNDFVSYNHDCYTNDYYLNKGDFKFEKVETSIDQNNGCSLAGIAGNFGFGKTNSQLYIVNDFGDWIEPNSLIEFNEALPYDVTADTNLGSGLYGMGVANFDINNDGFEDFYLTNIGSNQFLVSNKSDTTYSNMSFEYGIESEFTPAGNNSTSWGSLFFDFDNDRNTDLFVSNGFISSVEELNTDRVDANKLYSFNGTTFDNVTNSTGLGDTNHGRGAVYSDWDNDGDLDLIVSNVFLKTDDIVDANRVLFYENTIGNSNNWIQFDLFRHDSSSTVGAEVRLYKENSILRKLVISGSSYASELSKIIHFGLGDYESIDSVMVLWNSSSISTYKEGLVLENRYRLVENETKPILLGCTDLLSLNYNQAAELNSGCKYEIIKGCTDSSAINYNPLANLDDNSCISKGELIAAVTNDENVTRDYVVYPNPFTDYLKVDLLSNLNAEISLKDLSGKTILNKRCGGSNSECNLVSIDVNNGIYLLCVHIFGRQEECFKILKGS